MNRHGGFASHFGYLLTGLAVVLVGCGGGDDGPAAPTPGAPVISNLAVASSPQTCTVRSLPGRLRNVSFDYSDAEGDCSGGVVNLGLRLTGQTFDTLSLGVPSTGVTITGTTGGRVTVSGVCVAIVGRSDLTLDVTLSDAAGNVSNQLSTTVAAQSRFERAR